MKTESKYCGVLTSPETKELLNSLREQVPGLTEAQMMHNLIMRFTNDIQNAGKCSENFIADLKSEVEAANEAREQLRKEKYDTLLANGRAVRAAAKATRPAKPTKPTKPTKAAKPAKTKKRNVTSKGPIDATPQAEWSAAEEE